MSEGHRSSAHSSGAAGLTKVEHQALNTKANAQNSPLLRLPPELRNRIYTYALYQDNIQIYPGWLADRRPKDKPELALLRTCRQILLEASPIFYDVNTFEFEYTFQIPRFALSLTRQNRLAIRSIRLYPSSVFSLVGDSCGLASVYCLPSLEELHFRGHLCREVWGALVVTGLRRDGRGVKVFSEEPEDCVWCRTWEG